MPLGLFGFMGSYVPPLISSEHTGTSPRDLPEVVFSTEALQRKKKKKNAKQ